MPHCRSCGIGLYQSRYGETFCEPCPKGYTTQSVGAKSIQQCIPTAEEICQNSNVCHNGICTLSNTYHYSCNCFKNYIGKYYFLFVKIYQIKCNAVIFKALYFTSLGSLKIETQILHGKKLKYKIFYSSELRFCALD